jgi:hypothetical protein
MSSTSTRQRHCKRCWVRSDDVQHPISTCTNIMCGSSSTHPSIIDPISKYANCISGRSSRQTLDFFPPGAAKKIISQVLTRKQDRRRAPRVGRKTA